MKIYTTQADVEKDIKGRVLAIEGDVNFECSISIDASIIVTNGDINAWDINAWDINAGDINARNINALNIKAGAIKAWDIKAQNINAGDINARNINAGDINALDIKAGDINAWDINAWAINARDISYHAFCCVYDSIICTSIQSRREIQHEPVCLEGTLTIKPKEDDAIAQAMKVLKEAGYKIVKG